MADLQIKQIYDDYVDIDGTIYKRKEKDHHLTYVETDKKKVEQLDKKADEIVEKLKGNVDVGAILKEAIRKLSPRDVEKLYKIMFSSKKQYKPITRNEHCADIKIGNFILPVVD
jgi:hypothetical protein